MQTFKTSANYIANYHERAGLIICKTSKQGGVCMPTSHPQFTDYLTAFKEALDIHEADALCKALLA